MSYPVRYRCPECDTIGEIQRSGYLADRSVTPYPLEGWSYVSPDEDYAADGVDGIRFICGKDASVVWQASGCGNPFYLSFVRYEAGERVPVKPEREQVTINPGPQYPRGPDGPAPGP